MIGIETQVCGQLPILKRYVFSRFRFNKEESEDVYGDAVLKIFRAIRNGGFKEGFSLSAYMRHVVWSVAIDRFRISSRLRNTNTAEYDYHFKTIEKSPEKRYEHSDEIDRFLGRIEHVEGIRRKILILLLFQGMSHDEIADTLDMPRATVSTHVSRARKQFGGIELSKVRTRENG